MRAHRNHTYLPTKQDQCTRALPTSCQLRSAYEGATSSYFHSRPSKISVRGHYLHLASYDQRTRALPTSSHFHSRPSSDQCTRTLSTSCRPGSVYEGTTYILLARISVRGRHLHPSYFQKGFR